MKLTRHPKFSVSYDRRQVTHLPPVSEGGPTISIVKPKTKIELVLLGGRTIYNRERAEVISSVKLTSLRYTVPEWLAFIDGVKAGDFDDLLDKTISGYILIRDSKDPEGPILAFTNVQIKQFFQTVRHGGYSVS